MKILFNLSILSDGLYFEETGGSVKIHTQIRKLGLTIIDECNDQKSSLLVSIDMFPCYKQRC